MAPQGRPSMLLVLLGGRGCDTCGLELVNGQEFAAARATGLHDNTTEPPLLEIANLTVDYRRPDGAYFRAVDHVSFSVYRGEAVGLVGESGSGKTSIASSIMGLLPPRSAVGGAIRLNDADITSLSDASRDRYRWRQVSIAFQGAMNAMDPVRRAVDQVAEPMTVHLNLSRRIARERAMDLLEHVGIPRARSNSYPHEMSGGMRQRAIIAMALACDPDLLIADEPGTALDVVVQGQILDLLLKLQDEKHLATLIVSHDLSVVRYLTSRCIVMYAGTVMESGPTAALFERPRNPYTDLLVRSFPSLDDANYEIPPAAEAQHGEGSEAACPFAGRCSLVMPRCLEDKPPLFNLEGSRESRCWLHGLKP